MKRSETKLKVRGMFEEMQKEMRIDGNIRLHFKDYKKRIAVTSLNKNIIRINKRLLNSEWVLNETGEKDKLKFIEKVLKHELMHIKLNTKWHPPRYFRKLI